MVDDYRIRRVLRAVKREPATTLSDLARSINLSNSRLGHLFRQQVGLDLETFLVNARLDKAAELLRSTDLSIKEIAVLVGYHFASNLDRAFKQKFAAEPADYRRKHMTD